MDIQKIAKASLKCGEDVRQEIESLKRKSDAVAAEAAAACDAYFADVRQREQNAAARVENLRSKMDDTEKQIMDLQPKFVEATVTDDSEAFDRIQNRITALEAQKSALHRQIELLTSSTVPGNGKLYAEAIAKKERMEKTDRETNAALDQLYKLADEQKDMWKEIRSGAFQHKRYSRDFQEMEDHYKNGGRSE